jgi:hypothetical protein
MRTFVVSLAVLILAVYGRPLPAEQAYGTYPYSLYTEQHSAPAAAKNRGYYRWRPLEEEDSKASTELRQPRPAWGRGGTDYTDEPFGLPPGTYRPIEERHTITPHLEGYRFRPIDPDEQRRNRMRNKSQERIQAEGGGPQSNGREGVPGASYTGEQTPAFMFRPDPRLDTPTRGAPSRYAFPMGSEAPRFRSR